MYDISLKRKWVAEAVRQYQEQKVEEVRKEERIKVYAEKNNQQSRCCRTDLM